MLNQPYKEYQSSRLAAFSWMSNLPLIIDSSHNPVICWFSSTAVYKDTVISAQAVLFAKSVVIILGVETVKPRQTLSLPDYVRWEHSHSYDIFLKRRQHRAVFAVHICDLCHTYRGKT